MRLTFSTLTPISIVTEMGLVDFAIKHCFPSSIATQGISSVVMTLLRLDKLTLVVTTRLINPHNSRSSGSFDMITLIRRIKPH